MVALDWKYDNTCGVMKEKKRKTAVQSLNSEAGSYNTMYGMLQPRMCSDHQRDGQRKDNIDVRTPQLLLGDAMCPVGDKL